MFISLCLVSLLWLFYIEIRAEKVQKVNKVANQLNTLSLISEV